jgi:hypothetical protein
MLNTNETSSTVEALARRTYLYTRTYRTHTWTAYQRKLPFNQRRWKPVNKSTSRDKYFQGNIFLYILSVWETKKESISDPYTFFLRLAEKEGGGDRLCWQVDSCCRSLALRFRWSYFACYSAKGRLLPQNSRRSRLKCKRSNRDREFLLDNSSLAHA